MAIAMATAAAVTIAAATRSTRRSPPKRSVVVMLSEASPTAASISPRCRGGQADGHCGDQPPAATRSPAAEDFCVELRGGERVRHQCVAGRIPVAVRGILVAGLAVAAARDEMRLQVDHLVTAPRRLAHEAGAHQAEIAALGGGDVALVTCAVDQEGDAIGRQRDHFAEIVEERRDRRIGVAYA